MQPLHSCYYLDIGTAAARSKFGISTYSNICSTIRPKAQGFKLLANAVMFPIRTEDATIPRSRPQSSTTTGTGVKGQSVIMGHIQGLKKATSRAG